MKTALALTAHLPLAVTETELSRLTGLSRSWLQHDRCGRRLIPFYRVGGGLKAAVRYSPARVLAALERMEEGGRA